MVRLLWDKHSRFGVGRLLLVGAAGLVSLAAEPSDSSTSSPLSVPDPIPVEREYVLRQWTRVDGLPHNRVQCLAQTPDGFLWVGTRAGVARFDGVRFANFTATYTVTMSDDNCRALAPAGAEGIWIATGRGLLRYDGEIQPVTPRPPAGQTGAGPQVALEALAVLASGRLWAAGPDGLWDVPAGTIEDLLPAQGKPPGPGAIHRLAVADAGGRELWVGAKNGLWRAKPDTGEWRETTPGELPPGSRRVHDLFGTPSKRVAYALIGPATPPRARLFHWANDAWQPSDPRWFENGGESPVGLVRNDGEVWLAAGRDGLLRIHEGRSTLYRLPTRSPTDVPLCLANDREGNLWVGMSEGGLLRLRDRVIRTITQAEGLPVADTWAVTPAEDGGVWIATGAGVGRWNGRLEAAVVDPRGDPSVGFQAVARDPGGVLWIGGRDGLYRAKPEQGRTAPELAEPAPEEVRTIWPESTDRIWVGTSAGLGLFEEGRFRNVAATPVLSATGIRALWEDRRDVLWVGTAGRGLATRQAGQWRTIERDDGLPGDTVSSLHEDAGGRLWAGTDRGLGLVDQNGRVAAIRMSQGLPDDQINCILEDADHNFWISHDRGIYRVARDDLLAVASGRASWVRCTSYREDDGVLNLDTSGRTGQPAGCRTPDGRLWFATAAGVVVIDPRRLPDNLALPVPQIEAVRANGVPLFRITPAHDALTAPYRRLTDATGTLELPAGGVQSLEIDFTAPTFVRPEETLFSHRLQGVDTGWNAGLPWRHARYANLGPGDYVFEVRAANAYGVNGPVQALRLHIPALFYQTAWFRIGCALLSGALLWGAYRWRLRAVEHRQQMQREMALMEQRLRLSRDLHDGLGANLTRIALLAENGNGHGAPAGNGNGNGRSPATTDADETQRRQLSTASREAALALREMIWATHPDHDTLPSLVQRLEQHAGDLLETADLRFRTRLPLELPDIPLTREARLAAFYVAKEAFNNAVRHAEAKEIRFSVECRANEAVFTIADDGKGFDVAHPPPSPTGGHGLGNMRERLRAVGGATTIASTPGQGTTITIRLPLPATPSKPGGKTPRHRRRKGTKSARRETALNA